MNIEPILSLDIVDVLSKYIKLNKNGASYKANCPFHNEKTPSFMVSPAKQIYKCFGCGESGNVISFVMKHDSLNFIDAVKKLALDHHIQVDFKEQDPETKKLEQQKEALYQVNQFAATYFYSQLFNPENALPLKYIRARFSDESIQSFNLGYAPDQWQGLIENTSKNGVKNDPLMAAGLIREKNGKQYDFFRGRVVFPVHNKYGRITAFSGRILNNAKDQAKYINTPETIVYSKSNSLYGIHLAHRHIKDTSLAILVEGNPDVIRLHEIGISNAIGSCGTSLTKEQIHEIKKLCNSVTMIYDGDDAGKKAIKRSGEMINKEGMYCNVILVPDGEDPDTFFAGKTKDQYDEYAKKNIQDFIFYFAEIYKDKAKNPDRKAKLIDDLSGMIINLPESSHDLYINECGRILNAKKIISDKIKSLKKDQVTEEKTEQLPKHVKASDFEKFGFYHHNNCYYFASSNGAFRGSNFIMKPMFHIQSVMEAKRIYEITNEYNYTVVIELMQKDLVALSRFKERVESLGNFLWEAGEKELNKLKRFLYETTQTCVEIKQLGWQKNGFFAWGNGIYNGEYNEADENGIVTHSEVNYYLPAFSKIYQNEDTLFVSERKFVHKPNTDISLNDYTLKLIEVFGVNAQPAICFYMATLFRDIISGRFGFFPILNLFGPKGAGKTELAISIMSFFGKLGKGPNINNTSKAALGDHVSQVSNACVHIDEYRNDIDLEKIEFLKGLWDGTGRTRMNMDKDKKKETTAVDAGIILSGQQMPTADIALFSRLVYVTFHQTEYNEAEKKQFNELKDIEKKGLTHITNQILSNRSYVKNNYFKYYDKASRDLSELLKEQVIEDRIFRNWLVILAAFATLESKIKMPFTYEQIIKQSAENIIIQNKETKSSNEISTFWNIVQYLAAEELIREEMDYKIELTTFIRTDKINSELEEPIYILYIQHSRILPLYRKHGRQQGEKILPTDSIDYYLRNDSRYLGKKNSVRFKVLDPKTGMHKTNEQDAEKKIYKITKAYAFDYEKLGISLIDISEIEKISYEVPF